MKKILWSMVFGMIYVLSSMAQDADYTNLVMNNSFEYAWQGQLAQSGIEGWYNSSWRPWYTTNINHNEFYGWKVTDWNFKSSTNNSQSLESSAAPRDQSFDIAIFGDKKFGEVWELYQVIDKDALPAGTYKIQALMAVRSDRRTTQRLFANQNVQYYGPETNYVKYQMTAGETASFAGWNAGNDELKEMVVYTTIGENDSLKIGVRTGGKKMDGTMAADNSTIYGCFKADFFRVTKIDPASPVITDAALATLSVNAVAGPCALVPAFDPEITTYSCELPKGTERVTPQVQTRFEGATFNGAGTVNVSSGTGISTIAVMAVDGVTTKTYTINYHYATNGPTDLTGLIVNNSFEYASDGTLLDADGDQIVDDVHTGNGKDANGYRVKNSVEKEYYRWNVSNWDFCTAGNNSQGMNRDFDPINKIHGNYGVWLGGDQSFKVAGANTNTFEFYQVIDKNALEAGTYKIQCLLAVEDAKRTSQRLFANQNVQYHGTEAQYVSNQTGGEVATFAGWGNGAKNLQEMKVFTTIGENDSLRIGIRTGNIKGDGSIATSANPLWGWFKVDYFRLVKIDPADAADATLKSLSLSSGMLTFDPATTTYQVTVPTGTLEVTPTAVPNMEDAMVTGANTITLSDGTGTSTITVKALDGTTAKVYTINYKEATTTGLEKTSAGCSYCIVNNQLSVKGVDSYSIFSVNGVKISEVKHDAANTMVKLPSGVYILKTNALETIKVLIP